ncbi:rhomboid family intramembrane serine protease [Flavobacterium sp. RNTU_13]|uniref:rhomboid family intramembrane serine protease n=1 Tax=Flavobacterium sp. RNTU_13 TaxID=3375145 RepID=UPI003987C89D
MIDLVLIVVMAVTALVSFKGFNDPYFLRNYDFHVGSIRAGEQIRMFSSGFLHADLQHLLLNMLTLYFFGPLVVAYLGSVGFLLVYFCSLVAGSLLTLYLHRNEYSYRALGASGAIMGVVFSAVLLQPDARVNFIIPAWIFGLAYMLFSIYGMRARRDNIGHTAHFGGAVGGYLVTLIRMPELLQTELWLVLLLLAPIVLLFVLYKMGKL